jgi:hypothetical protein
MVLCRTQWLVWERDGYMSQYCGRTPRRDHAVLTVDHVTPESKGGTDDYREPDNLLNGLQHFQE